MRSGILNINKPSGWTSHDVVAHLRTLLKVKKAGHAGTLDPEATGVLPVCFGKGTKVVEYLVGAKKEYRVTMRLGEETDTEDATGTILRRIDAFHVSEKEMVSALGAFVGSYDQLPPIYSAVKVKGLPMYKSARAGLPVQRVARRVEIYRIAFEKMVGRDVSFTVLCSKGTYVRTLCFDVGRRLSVGAHLLSLCRSRVGIFRLEDAIEVSHLEQMVRDGTWVERAYGLEQVLEHLQKVVVDEALGEKVCHGVPLSLSQLSGPKTFEGPPYPEVIQVYGKGRGLLALAKIVDSGPLGQLLKIEKVLVESEGAREAPHVHRGS